MYVVEPTVMEVVLSFPEASFCTHISPAPPFTDADMGPEGSRGLRRAAVRWGCTEAQDCDALSSALVIPISTSLQLPSGDLVWVELSRSRFSKLSLVQVHTRTF